LLAVGASGVRDSRSSADVPEDTVDVTPATGAPRTRAKPRLVDRGWLTSTTVLTALFVIAVAATWAYFAHLMRQYTVADDDLLAAQLGHHLRDYIEPYGETLALIPIAVYRLIYVIFGFEHYKPLVVLGTGSQMSIAVAVFLVVRSRVGVALAFVAGVALLWYPQTDLYPSVFNHFFAMTAIIVCSWALRRSGTKYDVLIAVALTFALCNAPVAVAGAAGCITYIALARAPLRRWCVVAIPTAAYALWTLTFNRSRPSGRGEQTFADIVRFVYDGIMSTFRGLAFDNRALGVVLALGFVALLASRLRSGLRASRHEVAWTVALVAWFFGLAITRGVVAGIPGDVSQAFGSPEQFRYRLVGAAFVILACLPDQRAKALIRWASRPWPAVGAVALAALFVMANIGDIVEKADARRDASRLERSVMIAANLGPGVVPDDVKLALTLAPFTGREYRDLVAEYGAPGGTKPAHPDAAIVALRDIGPKPVAPATGDCVPLADPTSVRPLAKVVLRAGAEPVTVRIRRFEDRWVTVGTIEAGQTGRLDLPGLQAVTPWVISAPGACRVTG
jgi:hypothetical protein